VLTPFFEFLNRGSQVRVLPGAPTFAYDHERATVGKPTLDPCWFIPSAPKFVVIRPNERGRGSPAFASLAKG
jgi:hypothetical protein